MPKFTHNTAYYPKEYQFLVSCDKDRQVLLLAYDATRKNTFFMDRWKMIGKQPQKFICKMPLSPLVTTFEIKNNVGGDNDSGIKLISKDVVPLKTSIGSFPYWDIKTASFIRFASEFCMKAGYCSTGTYASNDGKFVIFYEDVIKNTKTNANMNTPACIDSNTGHIEVAKEKFKEYTVAGRMAILLHEFCHVFANKNMHDEAEADKNAAMIYLGLGFPRIEILNVFSEVFYSADNQLNRNRYEALKKIVDNFDKTIFNVSYY